jgi:hypothetical protein
MLRNFTLNIKKKLIYLFLFKHIITFPTTSDKQMTNNHYPTIDAHFWVERDGVIIDPYFQTYDQSKKFWNLSNEQVYLEADQSIQRIMIEIHTRVLKKVFIKNDLQEALQEHAEFCIKYDTDKPQPNRCWRNVCLEVYKNGGQIKFGSMGWKRENSNDVFYEYGGVNWKIKDFIK